MDLVVPGFGLLIWQLSGLIYLGFWVYVVFDCLRHDFREPNQKLIWILMVLFAPIIGTFLYLSMGKSSKKKGQFQPNFKQDNSN